MGTSEREYESFDHFNLKAGKEDNYFLSILDDNRNKHYKHFKNG